MSIDGAGDLPADDSASLPWARMAPDSASTLAPQGSDLAYLMTARMMVRRDRADAIRRLGIRTEVADLLERLSSQQVARIAASRWPCVGPLRGM